MRLVLLCALSLHFPEEHPGGESWFGADKAKHFFMSAFIESASYTSARFVGLSRRDAMWTASGVTAAVGIGKELHDRHVGGEFSLQDLTWDGAGGLAAALMMRRTKN